MMSDETLSRFIPKYGDRMALKQFCNQKHYKRTVSKKQTLLEKLRKKIKNKTNNKSSSSSEDDTTIKKQNIGNQIKDTRHIEVGWLCSLNGSKLTHVRTKQGGGTRKLSVPKTANKNYIISKAIELFFPNNNSTKGHLDKFSVELLDFKSHVINDYYTVEEMFKISALARLRFYLATKEKDLNVTSDRLFQENNEPVNKSPDNAELTMVMSQDSKEDSKYKGNTDFSSNEELKNNSSEKLWDKNTDFSLNNEFKNNLDEKLWDKNTDFYTQLVNETLLLDFDDIDQNLTSPLLHHSPRTELRSSDEEIILNLHRGHVFNELINQFVVLGKDCGSLNIKMCLPNGELEMGQDMGGVFRDALSEFWSTFYAKCTVGTTCKVPYIRHDFNYDKWSAIAKILYKGWKDVHYFPIEMSQVFIEYCILGKINSSLIDSFFIYLSKNEAETIKKALEDFENVDNDELMEVLENLDCKVLVNKDNVINVIKDIAHKEIIQKPMYVIDTWNTILNGMLSLEELKNIYNELSICSKHIIMLLECSSLVSPSETKVFTYLKKFIREADNNILKSFLRFCTGADVITKNKIIITFNLQKGFSRVPVAHTCACTLELPATYESFPEFRSELISILSSNVWIMDFV